MKILLLDNYDSFTYNLADYLQQAGAEVQTVRNDALQLADFEEINFDAFVLSPGPCRPAEAGVMPALLARWHRRVPILGVCLGHQAIGEFFGATLARAPLPMHGKTSRIRHDGHALFAGIPAGFSVMRYHSLVLENLPDGGPLHVLARVGEGGEIMAVAHRSLPIFGVQFHPESILTEFGLLLLKNWLGIALAAVPSENQSGRSEAMI